MLSWPQALDLLGDPPAPDYCNQSTLPGTTTSRNYQELLLDDTTRNYYKTTLPGTTTRRLPHNRMTVRHTATTRARRTLAYHPTSRKYQEGLLEDLARGDTRVIVPVTQGEDPSDLPRPQYYRLSTTGCPEITANVDPFAVWNLPKYLLCLRYAFLIA